VLLDTLQKISSEMDAVGFTPWAWKIAGGQLQDRVQIALVHQVGADLFAHVAFEQHIVGQHHRRPAAGAQGPIDGLQEAELLVAGGKSEIGAAGQTAALFGAKGGY
jgi:hypothetical protein